MTRLINDIPVLLHMLRQHIVHERGYRYSRRNDRKDPGQCLIQGFINIGLSPGSGHFPGQEHFSVSTRIFHAVDTN